MTTFNTPKNPREFIETMLRSSIEADRLASENINDRWLLEAHTHTAVNGHVAAMAMEMLRQNAPQVADDLAEHLNDTLTRGDLGGPTYRAAVALSFDPDQWITEHKERAAARGAKPEAGRRTAHIALNTLADRWEQMAGPAPDPSEGLFVDEVTPAEAGQHERNHTYRTVARDLREVLRTGQIPHPIMTDAELEQYGTKEAGR